MSNKVNNLTTKRFVIRKSLIGKHTIITFVNKKNETVKYNHDEVYNTHKERFESMNCFAKYKITRTLMRCQHSAETYKLSKFSVNCDTSLLLDPY